MNTTEPKPIPLLPVVLCLFGLIVAFHVGSALTGRSFIRASHLGTALEYAQGKIDLLRPVIVGFNANGAPTAQELPVWQALAAATFKATGSRWYGWANLVSLALFATALPPFLRLSRRYVGERAAWWATAFFLAQPIIVVMAGEAATDGFCLVVTIWFVFFADKMLRTGNGWWWFPTALFGALGAISKLPFFMAAGIFAAFLLLVKSRDRSATLVADSERGVSGPKAADPPVWRLWILLASAGAFAAVVFVVWTRYADSLSSQAEYQYVELRLSKSHFITAWYFGDMGSRLSLGPWLKGGWRFLHATLGSLPLAGLLIAALVQRGNRIPKLWLLATFLTTLVFTHLILAHWHYYLMCCPAVALLCGATLARWEEFWTREMPRQCLRLGLALIVLVFSATEGLMAMKIGIDYDPYPKDMAALLRQHTKPEDKLIVYNCDVIWGGEVLYRSDRNGMCVARLTKSPDAPTEKGLIDLLTSEADLSWLKSMGYNKLVLISQSPVQFAAVAINPGSKRRRIYYPATISPEVDKWPEVYRSEDLLIKDI